MKRIMRWVIGILVLGGLGYGGWLAYNSGTFGLSSSASAAASASSVTVVQLASGSLTTSVIATGSVRTNQNAAVAWQTSGKVGALNVAVGDVVQAGTVLASLDTGSLPTAVLTAKADLATAQAALAALSTSQTPLYQAEVDVITAQTDVDKAQSHRDMMNSATRGTAAQINQAEQDYARAQDNVNRLRQIYERLPGDPATELHNKAPALLNLEKAKTARDTALATLNWYAAKWSASDIAAADQALAVAKATLADAKTALAKIQNGADNTSLAAAQLRITKDQAIIATANLTAPIGGTVTSVSAQVGDIVSKGKVSFRIDDTSAYFVDLAVSEVDVASLLSGQAVIVTFDAIADRTYTGMVTTIGQVGTTTNSVVNFPITVQITDADSAIKPGLTAAATIVTAAVDDALVIPGGAIKTLNGQKLVYLVSGANQNDVPGGTLTLTAGGAVSLKPVVVSVGLTTDTGVQVTSSQLKVGDLIAVNPSADQLAGLAKNTYK